MQGLGFTSRGRGRALVLPAWMTVPGGIESAEMAAERELLKLQQIEEEEDEDDDGEDHDDDAPGYNMSSDKCSSLDRVSMTDQEGTGH